VRARAWVLEWMVEISQEETHMIRWLRLILTWITIQGFWFVLGEDLRVLDVTIQVYPREGSFATCYTPEGRASRAAKDEGGAALMGYATREGQGEAPVACREGGGRVK
jgi:hypothetical protein